MNRSDYYYNMKEKNILSEFNKDYGLHEIVGKKHNPIIVDFFKEIGHEWVNNDETPWCSASMSAKCKRLGLPYSKKLDARSWLNMGLEETDKPEAGRTIVVFHRGDPNSWMGHVTAYVHHDENYIYGTGGNQGNQIKTSTYKHSRKLAYLNLW